jgi:hypothetical protein
MLALSPHGLQAGPTRDYEPAAWGSIRLLISDAMPFYQGLTSAEFLAVCLLMEYQQREHNHRQKSEGPQPAIPKVVSSLESMLAVLVFGRDDDRRAHPQNTDDLQAHRQFQTRMENWDGKQRRVHPLAFVAVCIAAALIYSPARFAGASDIDDFVLLAGQVVIVDEELLKLFDKLFAQIIDILDMRPSVITLFDCDDAIIALFLAFLSFLALDNADWPTLQDASRECGFIHQHQHINGIAVLGLG